VNERAAKTGEQRLRDGLLAAADLITTGGVGGLILRDGLRGPAVNLIDIIAGTACLAGGVLFATGHLGDEARCRRRFVTGGVLLLGAFVVYAGHLL
jgi:hypothetical protein